MVLNEMAGENRVEYCYTWIIENYSMCYRMHKEALRSPIFTPNNSGAWFLKLYPLGRKKKEFQSCVLCRSDEDLGVEEISVAFEIEILDKSGNIVDILGDDTCKCDFKRGTQIGWDDLNTSNWKKDNLTIRCRMISFFPAVSEAVTEVEIDRCSFYWTIDFNDCLADRVTRKFSFSKASQYQIAVSFPNEEIEIKICKLEENPTPKIICGKMHLINNLGVKVLSQNSEHMFDTADDGNETWNYPSFILRSQLELEDNQYVKNGAFRLLCEFSETNGQELSRIGSSTNNYFASKLNNIVTLHSDLKNIFSNMKYSDIKLQVENVVLPAHKAVLSGRSPVFSVLFDQDMIENKSGIVEIADVDVTTLKSFLEFLYTGNVKFQDCSSALKLLMAAEKYQVPSLKDTCSEYLIPALSIENVCEILVAADMVNLKKLKKCAMDYIAKHTTEIFNFSTWAEFTETNTELWKEMFSYFTTNYELRPKKS